MYTGLHSPSHIEAESVSAAGDGHFSVDRKIHGDGSSPVHQVPHKSSRTIRLSADHHISRKEL